MNPDSIEIEPTPLAESELNPLATSTPLAETWPTPSAGMWPTPPEQAPPLPSSRKRKILVHMIPPVVTAALAVSLTLAFAGSTTAGGAPADDPGVKACHEIAAGTNSRKDVSLWISPSDLEGWGKDFSDSKVDPLLYDGIVWNIQMGKVINETDDANPTLAAMAYVALSYDCGRYAGTYFYNSQPGGTGN